MYVTWVANPQLSSTLGPEASCTRQEGTEGHVVLTPHNLNNRPQGTGDRRGGGYYCD